MQPKKSWDPVPGSQIRRVTESNIFPLFSRENWLSLRETLKETQGNISRKTRWDRFFSTKVSQFVPQPDPGTVAPYSRVVCVHPMVNSERESNKYPFLSCISPVCQGRRQNGVSFTKRRGDVSLSNKCVFSRSLCLYRKSTWNNLASFVSRLWQRMFLQILLLSSKTLCSWLNVIKCVKLPNFFSLSRQARGKLLQIRAWTSIISDCFAELVGNDEYGKRQKDACDCDAVIRNILK